MATISYPSTLPQYVNQAGFSHSPENPVISTDTDIGPKKRRLRYTAVPEYFSGTLRLTEEQYAIFRTFWKDTLVYGALEFNWVHPLDRIPVEVRMTDSYKAVPVGIEWDVTISFEVMP